MKTITLAALAMLSIAAPAMAQFMPLMQPPAGGFQYVQPQYVPPPPIVPPPPMSPGYPMFQGGSPIQRCMTSPTGGGQMIMRCY
jgi:hypothetical protein